jgi:hypothetical protein
MASLGMTSRTNSRSLGAYGLRILGADEAGDALADAPEDWPPVELSVDVGDLDADEEHLDDERARVRLRTGGWVEIERDPGRAHFVVPAALTPDELVHPFLAPVAAVCSHWYGRESLHGGGIALGQTVWGVIGGRHGGKSSLLAALAARGVEVVSDDVLVLDQARVFPGPRTIDLREDAAEALGLGDDIGVAGTRRRWRVTLPPIDRDLSLGGWVFAEWADETELRRLPASETFVRLAANRSISAPPRDPAVFLQLSALPAWELRRPRSWSAMPDVLEVLLGALDEARASHSD